jgi:hypothetical protein
MSQPLVTIIRRTVSSMIPNIPVTVIPVVVPIYEDKCPECGKPESVIPTCSHCGYKYPRKGSSDGMTVLVAVIVSFAAIWAFATTLVWVVEGDGTLIEAVKSQGRVLIDLSKRLW